ncbi:uncharacterized protein LOC144158993 isoform X2 [Haemaphysalis longicornis]
MGSTVEACSYKLLFCSNSSVLLHDSHAVMVKVEGEEAGAEVAEVVELSSLTATTRHPSGVDTTPLHFSSLIETFDDYFKENSVTDTSHPWRHMRYKCIAASDQYSGTSCASSVSGDHEAGETSSTRSLPAWPAPTSSAAAAPRAKGALSRHVQAVVVKVEDEEAMPEGVEADVLASGMDATPQSPGTDEAPVQFSCRCCPFTTDSQAILLDHIKEHPGLPEACVQRHPSLHEADTTGPIEKEEVTQTKGAGSSDTGCTETLPPGPSLNVFSCHLCPFNGQSQADLKNHIKNHPVSDFMPAVTRLMDHWRENSASDGEYLLQRKPNARRRENSASSSSSSKDEAGGERRPLQVRPSQVEQPVNAEATPNESGTGTGRNPGLYGACSSCEEGAGEASSVRYLSTVDAGATSSANVSSPKVSSDNVQGLDSGARGKSGTSEKPGTSRSTSSSGDMEVGEPSSNGAMAIDVGSTNAHCATDLVVTQSNDSTKSFHCRLCPYVSGYKGNVTKHVRTHTRETPFTCNVCSRSFTQRGTLTRHSITHIVQQRYKCTKCHATWFKSEADLSQHMDSHIEKEAIKCDVCSQVFPSRTMLTAHLCTHTNDKPFKCMRCPRSFAQKIHLEHHMRKHTEGSSHVCDVCSRSFTSKGHLLLHSKVHKR